MSCCSPIDPTTLLGVYRTLTNIYVFRKQETDGRQSLILNIYNIAKECLARIDLNLAPREYRMEANIPYGDIADLLKIAVEEQAVPKDLLPKKDTFFLTFVLKNIFPI